MTSLAHFSRCFHQTLGAVVTRKQASSPDSQVEDIASAYAELVSAGVEVSELHELRAWRWAYFRAPDGCLYEICQTDEVE